MMWWLCIRFPSLMLDSLSLRESTEATAVIERQVVLQANTTAIEQGIQPGHSMATALSLYPELHAVERQTKREKELLEHVAVWAYRFSPQVSIDTELSVIFLEIRGSLKLFRGFNRLFSYLSQGIKKRNLQFYCGLSHNPVASYLISYSDKEPGYYRQSPTKLDNNKIQQQLKSSPVTLLPCSKNVKKNLKSMGLNHISAVFLLPSTSLGKRFGRDFFELIAYLKNEKKEHRPLFFPPEYFHSSCYFTHGLNNKQQLDPYITQLLTELKNHLRLRQLINRQLNWQLNYIDGGSESMLLDTSLHVFQQQSLFDITLLKLEQLKLRANIESLSLSCKRFEKSENHNDNLFQQQDNTFLTGGDSKNEQYSIVMDKLLSRLQSQHCIQLSAHNDLLPEKAWRATQYTDVNTSDPLDRNATPPRPLWLLSKPAVIQQHQQQLYWQGYLQLLQGPERIDNQWWQQRHARDYYIALHSNGSIYWIFKDQIKRQWFVHGLFS
ncbi:MAG: DNA polymerase Y family protein [Oceanicoccus sp.]